MKILVQKFGGTSVATEQLREACVKVIRQAVENGYRPVVVVSAMGRSGAPYATDTLKAMAETIYPRMELREMDLLMSCGETISAVVMAAALCRAGLKARAFTGAQAGLLTDGFFGQSQVTSCRPEKVLLALESGEIAVVAGFQGATAGGEITTLGRGGSDTTAVILGSALKAELVEIYTDVNGISTADPNILKEARILPELTYSEVCQLAYDGAKVIHPAAVEVAMKHGLLLVVRSIEGPGTLICAHSKSDAGFSVDPHRVVAGIAHSSGLFQVVVDFQQPNPDLEVALFENLGKAGVSIDLISVFPDSKIFTVKEDALTRCHDTLKELAVNYRVVDNCAKVSVVGLGMRGIPGVMARVVRALREKQIDILQTADSNISISVLIKQEALLPAIQTLHEQFALDEVAASYSFSALS